MINVLIYSFTHSVTPGWTGIKSIPKRQTEMHLPKVVLDGRFCPGYFLTKRFGMNTTMNKLALAIGALVMAGGAMAAGSESGTMGTSAAILNECSVGNFSPLAFGTLAMLSNGAQSSADSASTGGGTFDAICTNGAPTPKLKFTSANTGTGTINFQLIGTDGSLIVYTLKESSTGGTAAIVYGTDAAFTGFTATGTTKSLSIAGSITAEQKKAKKVQPYSDTITITSSFGL